MFDHHLEDLATYDLQDDMKSDEAYTWFIKKYIFNMLTTGVDVNHGCSCWITDVDVDVDVEI